MIRTPENNKKKKGQAFNLAMMLLFFPITIFYLEMVVRLNTIGPTSINEFFNILFFSFCGGFIISAIITLIRNKTALKIATIITSIVFTLILGSQLIYFKIFQSYYSLDSLGMAGSAMTDFSAIMMDTIYDNMLLILILFLPTIILAYAINNITQYPKKLHPLVTYFCVSLMALSFILGSVSVTSDNSEYGALYYYKYPDSINTAGSVGLLTSTRLNLQKMIFGGLEEEVDIKPGMNEIDIPFESEDETGKNPPSSSENTPTPPVVYGDNIIENLNFSQTSGTIGGMNKYFSSLTPTKKNQYTGMFEGYNLIFLTLEGFSGKVIDPNLTPTLYMMANQGFVFENYYNSTWGGSTSTGEYANLTGNFYDTPKCMTEYIANTYQPFTLGNQFKNLGYTTKAYHAWSHTYYNRHKSHPSIGYEWIAYNRNNVAGYIGLEALRDKNGNGMKFPSMPSDHDTARVTIPDFINEDRFHVYYMTVSGHTPYNWGIQVCKKHKAEINDYCQKYNLDYSEDVKAYLASQLEVELMLTELVEALREAGKLDNTVFVMGADHYPYGLPSSALAELYEIPEENIYGNLELYRSSLIIWNSAMEEPVHVDVPCSAIDILPTVSNLFGLEYDSRLMAGTDILSGTDPIVIINFDQRAGYWNWVTRYGAYTTVKKNNKLVKVFIPSEGFSASEEEISAYVNSINNLVAAKKKYTFQVIENNYYAYVFGKK